MKLSSNDILFLIVFSGFMVGVFLRSFFEIPLWVFAGLFVWVLVIFVISKSKQFLIFSFIGLIVFSLGVARFEIAETFNDREILDVYVEEKIVMSGIISQEVDLREKQQRIIVEIDSIEGVEFSKTKVLVSTDLYPRFEYGDLVEVEAKIRKPENFETDSGREFDYINYLGKDGISYTASFAKVSVVEKGLGNPVKRGLLKFKKTFLDAANRAVPEPESALLGGILLGVKQSLGDSLEQSFIDTGTIHIVVLSGYNVTIVAEAIVRAFAYVFSQTIGLSLGALSIVLFAVITGGGATVVRASLMALIALLARVTGRTNEITRALVVAAILMVLHNPYVLVFDISFQLSFLATLGLIYIAPIVEVWFKKIPKFFGFRQIVAATVATQIAVLPYLLYRIGTLSIISPIANVLVLPLVPPAMFFGFLAGMLEMVSGVVASPFAWIAYGLLHIKIRIVEILSGPSWSAITISKFSIIFVVVGYFLITWWLVLHYKNEYEKI